MHLAILKRVLRSTIERCNVVEARKVETALNILSAKCAEENVESLLAGLSLDAAARRITLEEEEAQR